MPANPMTTVKRTNAVPIRVRRTTPSNCQVSVTVDSMFAARIGFLIELLGCMVAGLLGLVVFSSTVLHLQRDCDPATSTTTFATQQPCNPATLLHFLHDSPFLSSHRHY